MCKFDISMLNEFMHLLNIFELQYKVNIEIISWLDLITIEPILETYSTEEI
jgi:hypothetical protein